MSDKSRWLYLVVTAAPPVLRIQELVGTLTCEGWSVCVIATPNAASWTDLDELAAATGCITRVHSGSPRQRESLPRAAAVLAAPMTFNSINKWAAGFSDTFALGILNEMLGTGVPIVVVPCVKAVLRRHPAYGESVARLVNAGASIMDPDAVTVRADDGLATFDWPQIVAALRDVKELSGG
ncbi:MULTISPECIES: flavoprotein [Amycolatopsis]|uniref:flavoprotein n=1 Tax=Amycolatopsis TaxID=1813 RepID=UPI00055C44EF|nr:MULTISPECIES: flavoprotein [Amycolatopsis]